MIFSSITSKPKPFIFEDYYRNCSGIQSLDMKFQWEGPSVTGRPDSQVSCENSAANATKLKSSLSKYSPEIKAQRT